MCGPWGMATVQYGRNRHNLCFIAEWNLTGEHLRWSRPAVSKSCMYRGLSVTRLYHDQSERINIRFFAGIFFVQDFRRGPPWSVNILACGRSYRIQVLGYHGNAEICD